MAKLLPPYIDRSCKSTGEKMLFQIFKNSDFSKDWIVLHSLNLSLHTTRLYGEIDFLILIPHGGIYIMEVKGGDVKCVNGIWQFTDKFNNTYTSNVGPFNQARDAMFSLKSAVEKEFGKGHKFTRCLFGFLCAFPQVSFDKHSVEFEEWQILDKVAIQDHLPVFFEKLVTQSIKKHKGQRWFTESASLPGVDELNQLCDFFRGDFERVRSVKDRLEEFEQQVKSYTSEQYRVLDHIHLNARCLIQGSAGTGKTMIALESAVRAAMAGERVFLTCFNRLIGEWMQSQLGNYRDRIVVSSLHAYLLEESRGFDYVRSQSDSQDFYSKYLPSLLTDIYRKGISQKFDRIIIDEAQDLITVEYLTLFDSMVVGGLCNGNWEMYGDFEKQAIFSNISREEMFSLISRIVHPSRFFLKINCRNSRQIGEETALISGFERPPFLLEYLDGVPVEYSFYSNQNQQTKLLEAQIRKLLEKGLPLNRLMIIASRRFETCCASCVTGLSIKEIKHTNEILVDQSYIAYATIQSYKGMESDYAIVTDIEDLVSDSAKSLLYVAMSRPKYGLIMLVSESLRGDYRRILQNKLTQNAR